MVVFISLVYYKNGTLVYVIRGCNCPVITKTIKSQLDKEHKVLEGKAERIAVSFEVECVRVYYPPSCLVFFFLKSVMYIFKDFCCSMLSNIHCFAVIGDQVESYWWISYIMVVLLKKLTGRSELTCAGFKFIAWGNCATAVQIELSVNCAQYAHIILFKRLGDSTLRRTFIHQRVYCFHNSIVLQNNP